jgi:hypothetical protein
MLYQGKYIIDVLHSAYFEDEKRGVTENRIVPINSIESRYRGYIETIKSHAGNRSLSCKVRKKWKWMLKYTLHSMKQQGVQA